MHQKNLNEEFLESLDNFNSEHLNHLKYERSFQVGSSHVVVGFHMSNDHLVISVSYTHLTLPTILLV